jgi:hypothetical protein
VNDALKPTKKTNKEREKKTNNEIPFTAWQVKFGQQ